MIKLTLNMIKIKPERNNLSMSLLCGFDGFKFFKNDPT